MKWNAIADLVWDIRNILARAADETDALIDEMTDRLIDEDDRKKEQELRAYKSRLSDVSDATREAEDFMTRLMSDFGMTDELKQYRRDDPCLSVK